MSMMRAQVVTPWYRATIVDEETGATFETDQHNGCRCPQVAVDYPLATCSDVTSQPSANIVPTPNALTVEITCEQSVLDQMDADGVPILCSEAG